MKKLKTWAAALLAVSLLASCAADAPGGAQSGATPAPSAAAAPAPEAPAAAKPTKDREGNDIAVPDTLARIISTAPSNTEILVGLGLADKLVAVDKYSADVAGIDPALPQIDFRQPDAEALVALEPDILIASGHNRKGDEDPFALLKEAGICVVYIPTSTSIEGICGDIAFLGDLTGAADRAKAIVEDYRAKVEEIRAIGRTVTEKKRVYFEIAPAPDLSSFGQGTFLNEFLEIVGAQNIFAGEEGWISPSAEAVVERNPDVILTNVSYVENAVEEIKSREGWGAVKAVADGQVFQVDANPASRPSQHSVTALWQIAKAVYPELYGQ